MRLEDLLPAFLRLDRFYTVSDSASESDNTAKTEPKARVLGADFTESVISTAGKATSARLKEVIPALIRHLHDFARDVNLTVEELELGVAFINECGKMSTDQRNETQLLSDILGLESLVDSITSRQLAAKAADASSIKLACTPSAILGPFYRSNAPILPASSSIVAPSNRLAYLSSTTHLSGRVLTASGGPIRSAILDIWHTAPNGMYEQQDALQPDMDLRGRFTTDGDGAYSLYCLRPVAYPIPDDGPPGLLLRSLDRHPFRPAHIHVIVSAPGFRTLTTQLFDGQDRWLSDDAVFAVKEELVVKFQPREGDEDARWTVAFDFVLMDDADAAQPG